jgi:hypothetical protein
MGKVFNTLLLSGLVSITLLLLDGTGYLGIIAQLFVSPQTNWGAFFLNALTSALGGATVLGGAAIIIGTLVIKQDWLVRAGMFTVVVSWVEAPFISLWQFIASKTFPLESCVNSYTCAVLFDGSMQTTLGMILSSILVGPLILYSTWAIFSWIWSPESTG